MKWSVATMSFTTDCSLVLTVAKSSSATVATDQLCGCKAQRRNRSYGDCSIATVAASQVLYSWLRSSASQPSQSSQPIISRFRSWASQLLQPSQLTKHLGCDAPFATVATSHLFGPWFIWIYLKGRRCMEKRRVYIGPYTVFILYTYCTVPWNWLKYTYCTIPDFIAA
jgi:hypothetical protein